VNDAGKRREQEKLASKLTTFPYFKVEMKSPLIFFMLASMITA